MDTLMTPRRSIAAALAATSILFVAGCGDDDEPSSQEQYCEAGDELRSSVDQLLSVDLIAGGLDGLQSSIDEVQSDLAEVRDTADDAAADEVDQLNESFDQLQTAVGDLGGELSTDNAAEVVSAVQAVGESAQAVFATLSDC